MQSILPTYRKELSDIRKPAKNLAGNNSVHIIFHGYFVLLSKQVKAGGFPYFYYLVFHSAIG